MLLFASFVHLVKESGFKIQNLSGFGFFFLLLFIISLGFFLVLYLSLPGLCDNGNEKEHARQCPGLHTLVALSSRLRTASLSTVLLSKPNFNSVSRLPSLGSA